MNTVWEKLVCRGPQAVSTSEKPMSALTSSFPVSTSLMRASTVTSFSTSPPSGVSSSSSLAKTSVAAVEHAEVLLHQVPGEGGELMDPFPRDGPLGQKGESLSLVELRSRSSAALEEFAWNAISCGTAKVYRVVWRQFIIFGCKIGSDVNKLSFDYSLVCEFVVYRLRMSRSVSAMLSSRSAIIFQFAFR